MQLNALFWLLSIVVCKPLTVESVFPITQWNALESLYNSTAGMYWNWEPSSEFWQVWNFSLPSKDPCGDHWQGLTCACDSQSGACAVAALTLRNYNLSGTLPNTICELNGLVNITIFGNDCLTGTLPSCIGQFSQLQTLIISGNAIEGGLPESLAQLRQLSQVNLATNHLSGPVSNLFSSFSHLNFLDLAGNFFTGPLPEFNPSLKLLSFGSKFNQFTGNLPASYANISFISLDLDGNRLSGDLSSATPWIAASTMKSLILRINGFYGNIDSILAPFTALEILNIAYNQFDGSVPLAGNWSHLTAYIVSYNQFDGTVPVSAFAEIVGTQSVAPYCISLSVTNIIDLPTTKLCLSLYYVSLESNYLDGPVPTIPFVSNVTLLYLCCNMFSGTLDSAIGQSLEILEVDHNYLMTGTLPQTLATLSNITTLWTSNNRFSGRLPASLFSSPTLTNFQASDNQFTGPFYTLFENLHPNSAIETIDVSNNQFTGPIPSEVFSISSLTTLSLSVNCFSGSIPVEVCNAHSLVYFLAIGLKTAPSCRDRIIPGSRLFSAFRLAKPVTKGPIPDCLFQLPTIQSIYVSGNAFTGTLPTVEQIAPSLVNLSVEHNALTGTLPMAFQNHTWQFLSIAYNRFHGHLITTPSVFYRNASVYASVNRLSGCVPPQLLSLTNIDILKGNMFSCKYDQSDLPHNDQQRKQGYTCGSDNVNRSLIIWFSFAALWSCIAGSCAYLYSLKRKKQDEHRQSDARDSQSPSPSSSRSSKSAQSSAILPLRALAYVVQVLDRSLAQSFLQSGLDQGGIFTMRNLFHTIRNLFVTTTLVAVIVLLPSYLVLSRFYRTQENKYIWTASSLMLSGIPPSAVLMCIYSSVVVAVWAWMAVKQRFVEKSNRDDAKHPLMYITYFTVNVVVMTAADIGFVVVSTRFGGGVQGAASFILAVFKTLWSEYYVKQSFMRLKLYWTLYVDEDQHKIELDFDNETRTELERGELSVSATNPFTRARKSSLHARQSATHPGTGMMPGGRSVQLNPIHNNNTRNQRSSVSSDVESNAEDSVPEGSQTDFDISRSYNIGSLTLPSSMPSMHDRNRSTTMMQQSSMLSKTEAFDNVLSASDYMAVTANYLLNSLWIPNIAVLFASPSCFLNAFVQASETGGTFQFNNTDYVGQITIIEPYGTSESAQNYDSPFIYSYTCASTFLTYYADSFVYLMIITFFVIPTFKILLKLGERYLRREYTVEGVHQLLQRGQFQRSWHWLLSYLVMLFLPLNLQALQEEPGLDNPRAKHAPLLDSFFIPQIYNLLGILLTYGVILPPMAPVICLGAVGLAYFEEASLLYLLYRVRTAANRSKYSWYLMRIDEEGQGLEDRFTNPGLIWLLLVSVTPIYAFSVFDTAADQNGWRLGTALSVTLVALPILLLLFRRLVPREIVERFLDRTTGRTRRASSRLPKLELSIFGRKMSFTSGPNGRRSSDYDDTPRGTRRIVDVLNTPWRPGETLSRDSDMATGTETSSVVPDAHDETKNDVMAPPDPDAGLWRHTEDSRSVQSTEVDSSAPDLQTNETIWSTTEEH